MTNNNKLKTHLNTLISMSNIELYNLTKEVLEYEASFGMMSDIEDVIYRLNGDIDENLYPRVYKALEAQEGIKLVLKFIIEIAEEYGEEYTYNSPIAEIKNKALNDILEVTV